MGGLDLACARQTHLCRSELTCSNLVHSVEAAPKWWKHRLILFLKKFNISTRQEANCKPAHAKEESYRKPEPTFWKNPAQGFDSLLLAAWEG